MVTHLVKIKKCKITLDEVKSMISFTHSYFIRFFRINSSLVNTPITRMVPMLS